MIKYSQLLEKIGVRDDIVWGSNEPDYNNKEFIHHGVVRAWLAPEFRHRAQYSTYFLIDKHLFSVIFIGISSSENKLYEIEFTRPYEDEVSIGRGNDMRIFSSVLTILLEFIKRINPDTIVFSGDTTKKADIYKRLARDRELLKTLNDTGYIFKGDVYTQTIKRKDNE